MTLDQFNPSRRKYLHQRALVLLASEALSRVLTMHLTEDGAVALALRVAEVSSLFLELQCSGLSKRDAWSALLLLHPVDDPSYGYPEELAPLVRAVAEELRQQLSDEAWPFAGMPGLA